MATNTTYGKLKVGKTYIVRNKCFDVESDIDEVQVLDKKKNALFIRVNPNTGNVLKWVRSDKELYEIIDEFPTNERYVEPLNYGMGILQQPTFTYIPPTFVEVKYPSTTFPFPYAEWNTCNTLNVSKTSKEEILKS